MNFVFLLYWHFSLFSIFREFLKSFTSFRNFHFFGWHSNPLLWLRWYDTRSCPVTRLHLNRGDLNFVRWIGKTSTAGGQGFLGHTDTLLLHKCYSLCHEKIIRFTFARCRIRLFALCSAVSDWFAGYCFCSLRMDHYCYRGALNVLFTIDEVLSFSEDCSIAENSSDLLTRTSTILCLKMRYDGTVWVSAAMYLEGFSVSFGPKAVSLLALYTRRATKARYVYPLECLNSLSWSQRDGILWWPEILLGKHLSAW